ncbi:MAG: peptide ABC transporter substrate-binding protein [Gammaproteobacteria bacterium]|nr:peptide ABC transporter substrate-binding protein [Gammaproteobacteria bacterium]
MSDSGAATTAPVLEVQGLRKYFPFGRKLFGGHRQRVHAVDGVDFSIAANETLGLVGESGCGKSTVGRTISRLHEPTEGRIFLEGTDITELKAGDLREHRRRMQMIFQDPFSSLDPRMTAGEIVGELLIVHEPLTRAERGDRVAALFERVGLRAAQMRNYPHEFSGGQRQRLGIARALSLNPRLIICDEPVSALDVSIQAQVINLLEDLQNEYGIAYLFIAHDLAVVEHISDRVAVMYLGRIVETAERAELFANPQHPYTESLLAAVPVPDPTRKRSGHVLEGDVPSPVDRPTGCHFHTRCPYAEARCSSEEPTPREVAPGHIVTCHLR